MTDEQRRQEVAALERMYAIQEPLRRELPAILRVLAATLAVLDATLAVLDATLAVLEVFVVLFEELSVNLFCKPLSFAVRIGKLGGQSTSPAKERAVNPKGEGRV